MKKRVVSLLMICALSVGMLAGCGSSETQNQATGSADNTQTAGTETVAETKTPEVADDANLTATQQIIKQAEGMTMEELAQKAIEESNGKTFYGVSLATHLCLPCEPLTFISQNSYIMYLPIQK